MSVFTVVISCLTPSNLPWFIDPTFQVPRQYHSLQHWNFTSITSHIHNWALFSLWLCLFILSGGISPLFSRCILSNYQPEEFIFQCHIFFPFYTLHGALKVRMLKWFAIPFSNGHRFVRNVNESICHLGRNEIFCLQHWFSVGCRVESPVGFY